MKLFIVAVLSAFLAVSARKCNKQTHCPTHWKCVFTDSDSSTGTCQLDAMHQGQGKIDYNRANRAFSAVDIDHNKKITFGGAYKALHTLVPGASEQMLDKLTKKGDKNKDGYIGYSEFVAMYRVLVDKTKHHGQPGDKCSTNPCGSDQMCRNCRNIKGYCCETVSTGAPSGALTQSERAQVNNIFTALNTNKDKGVSRGEFNSLLMAVRQTMGHDTKLYGEVYNYIIAHGDTNKDKIVEYSEFLKACQTLKSKDPKSFPTFLKAATKLKPLVLGDPCVRYGSGKKACPKGSACQRTRVQVQYNNKKSSDGKPRTYTSYRYFCTAASTTKKPITNVKAGKACTYGYCKSGCRKCAKNLTCQRKSYQYGSQNTGASGVCVPKNCKDCTKAHGTWMGSRCYFGRPGFADGAMFTKPQQCDHADAARKAKCYYNHDCKSCITKGTHKTLGALCAWRSWGSGSCQPNLGGGGMVPMISKTNQCPKTVVVHGRE